MNVPAERVADLGAGAGQSVADVPLGSEAPLKTPTRSLILDVVRGLAVLLVLVHHGIQEPDQAGFLATPLRVAERFGWTGVDLFFVLSGFLIGTLLMLEIQARRRLDVWRFVVRRAFKIWPSYFAYLAVSVVLVLPVELSMAADRAPWRQAIWRPEARWRAVCKIAADFAPNLLHIQNYFMTPLGHLWTLAVEEHFYLFLPFVLWLLSWGKAAPRFSSSFERLAPVLLLMPLTLRLLFFRALEPNALYQFTHFRMDSLFFGVLLAYVNIFRPQFVHRLMTHRRWLMTVGLACLVPAASLEATHDFIISVGYSLIYFGYGCLVLSLATLTPQSGWAGKLLWGPLGRMIGSVGYYSYTIYLWHMYVVRPHFRAAMVSSRFTGIPTELRTLCGYLCYFLVAYLLGVVTSKLVELPMLRIRNRIFPSRMDAANRAIEVGVAAHEHLGDDQRRAAGLRS